MHAHMRFVFNVCYHHTICCARQGLRRGCDLDGMDMVLKKGMRNTSLKAMKIRLLLSWLGYCRVI